MIYDLGIVVCAVPIGAARHHLRDIAAGFKLYCQSSNPTFIGDCIKPTVSYRIEVVTESDIPCNDMSTFNKSKYLNLGIKRCLSDCSIIVQTDIDFLVPPYLIDLTAIDTRDTHMWVRSRYIKMAEITGDWKSYMKLPFWYNCPGSWNAMSADNWRKVGGFDERCCYGWGAEDNILHRRIAEAGITTVAISNVPLCHIEHKPRAWFTHGQRGRQNKTFMQGVQPNFLEGA